MVELLIAMAIITLLIGLSVFAVTNSMRSARDTKRKNELKGMVQMLNKHIASQGQAPRDNNINGVHRTTDGNIEISTTTIMEGENVFTLEGMLKAVDSVADPSATTTSSQTRYCYRGWTTTWPTFYVIGVELERGGWYVIESDVLSEVPSKPSTYVGCWTSATPYYLANF